MNNFKRKRELQVVDIHNISLNMRRITFFSKDLHDFSLKEKGGYLKLLFSNSKLNKKENLVRPYTIRHFRKKQLQVDIDFVIHSKNIGIASKWATETKIGDKISVSGPGPKQEVKKHHDWFFFIGDMSALPAIAANLEDLNKNSKGIVILEIQSVFDKIEIRKPKNIEIFWLINKNDYRSGDSKLFEEVSKVKWLPGIPFIWAACEFTKMKKLRDYFQIEKKIKKDSIYISSYWRIGSDQEQHKLIKQKDKIFWDK